MRNLVLLFVLAAFALPAEEPAYRLKWNDLDRLARGRQVWMKLPSGIKLAGRVVSVEPDGLVLDVRKTSDKRAYPKGPRTVPRAEVTRLRINQGKGHTWRAAGTAIGGVLGLTTGAALASPVETLSDVGKVVVAAVIVVPPLLGYLAGRSADRKMMDVIVEPADAALPSR